MKQKAVRLIRRLLPESSIHTLEETYRKGRSYITSARYGHPARNLKVIAVTGTNGKTTTINYLNEILKANGFMTALFSTAVIEIGGTRHINDLNATVGTTDRMFKFFKQAKEQHVDYVLLEATSHALDQHKFDAVPFYVAIMTNLTQDHLDYHKTMDRYAAAKALLFARKPAYIILNRDDSWYEYFDQYAATQQKITYGQDSEADVIISDVLLNQQGSDATITYQRADTSKLHTALPGMYNVQNAVAAASAAFVLGVTPKVISDGIASLHGIPGRFERIDINTPYEVIVDYAHTPDAFEKLLEAARAITKKDVTIVFGATGDRDKGKRPIMGGIAARLADHIILTDEESYTEDPKAIRDQVRQGITDQATLIEIADRKDAIAHALKNAYPGDTILITGMGHELFRITDGKKLPWNDAAVVRELAADL